MTTQELIFRIEQKHKESGIQINPPASKLDFEKFHMDKLFRLPNDFIEFYSICNGFDCNEDIFRIIPLDEGMKLGIEFGKDWMVFSEYMIYSDTWILKIIDNDNYEIVYETPESKTIVLCKSLNEFLEVFLKGNVFEIGGLYDWIDKK